VDDVTGGLKRANGELCQRLVSGEAVMLSGGQLVPETLGLGPRANRRCSETPLSEASDEAGRWASLLTYLAGGLAREGLAHLPFVDFSLK
jgi:hypothetical protein